MCVLIASMEDREKIFKIHSFSSYVNEHGKIHIVEEVETHNELQTHLEHLTQIHQQ